MEDQKDFDKWYKTKITENDQDPPDDTWRNIADELDTHEVWDRIAVELDRPRGWFPSKAIYYSLPVLLLLLSGGAYFYFDRSHGTSSESIQIVSSEDGTSAAPPASLAPKTPSSSSGPQSEYAADEESRTTSEVNSYLNLSELEDTAASTKDPETEGAQDVTALTFGRTKVRDTENDFSTVSPRSKSDDDEVISVDAEDFRALPDRDADSFEASDKFLSATDEESDSASITGMARHDARSEITGPAPESVIFLSDFRASIHPVDIPDSMLSIYPVFVALHPDSLVYVTVSADPGKSKHVKTIEFGITASAKNTWLLNRTTLAGLEKHTLNTTLPDFGKDIGIVFTYNFSSAFSAQAEGMFLSEVGQRYKEYRNGKYVTRDVDLRYYTVNLLLKYNRKKSIHGLPATGHNIIGGVYAGRLKRATETINDQTYDRSNSFDDVNYGIIAGYEYNRKLLPNVFVSSGLRLNYGFLNIDKSLFSRTFTGSLDLNIALRYRMGL